MSQATLDDDELFDEAADDMRADAFEDAEDLADAIEEMEGTIADIEAAHESVGDLASTLPSLRGALEDAAEDEDDD